MSERGRCRYIHVSSDFPLVLTCRSSGSGSESGSNEKYDKDAPRRPLFAAAAIYMDQADGVFELYGALPLHFTE